MEHAWDGPALGGAGQYRHEAFFYKDLDHFVSGTRRFIDEAHDRNEPVLAVLSRPKIELLADDLVNPHGVVFADMEEVGRNPARIIAAWSEFLRQHEGGAAQVHGIGEPIWPERSAAELRECQLHEALLNAAFRGSSFRLLCPYDQSGLPDAVLAEALRTHPLVFGEMTSDASPAFPGLEEVTAHSRQPLPDPPASTRRLVISGTHDLPAVRELVTALALEAGLPTARVEDLVLAAHEMATNSVRHGGGGGLLRAWVGPGACILEFSDRGVLAEPLVGRFAPRRDAQGGRGFWLANSLCDLVQVAVGDHGTVVRLHAYL